MSTQKLLYIITQAPYSNAAGQEALEAVLIGCAFEQEVSVLFIHDGVFQLKNNQNIGDSTLKQYTKTYRALHDLGAEKLYAFDLSLTARGILLNELMLKPEIIDQQAVSRLIAEQFRVFTF